MIKTDELKLDELDSISGGVGQAQISVQSQGGLSGQGKVDPSSQIAGSPVGPSPDDKGGADQDQGGNQSQARKRRKRRRNR